MDNLWDEIEVDILEKVRDAHGLVADAETFLARAEEEARKRNFDFNSLSEIRAATALLAGALKKVPEKVYEEFLEHEKEAA